MEEINHMTLPQIKRYALEATNFKLQEQSSLIGAVAIGAQGTKDSIKNTLGSLSEAQGRLTRQITKKRK